jgi:hypothetical protein
MPAIVKRLGTQAGRGTGISFAVPINNLQVYGQNFAASPLFKDGKKQEIIELFDYGSASIAYNEAKTKANNGLIVYAHQDIIFPENWDDQLRTALIFLDKIDPNWGVLGCIGVSDRGSIEGLIYCTGNNGYVGRNVNKPEPVSTLDEIVLIIRKDSNLEFDSQMPFYHFYGTDICIAARKQGMNCYVIPAFCIHNSIKTLFFTREFYVCAAHIRRKYPEYLPIATTCTKLTGSVLSDRLSWYLRNIRHIALKFHPKGRYSSRRTDAKKLQEYVLSCLNDKHLTTRKSFS